MNLVVVRILLSVGIAAAAQPPPPASLLTRTLTAVRQPATTLRWNLKLVLERRGPMRLGVDLEVRENSKGRGLYALRTLEEGAVVGRYTGVAMPWSTFENSKSDGLYAMALANGDVIDGADEQRSNFVRFINHSVRKANCKACDAWEEDDPLAMAAVYIETERQIAPGEELLFDYGHGYWDEQMPRFSPKRLAIDYL